KKNPVTVAFRQFANCFAHTNNRLTKTLTAMRRYKYEFRVRSFKPPQGFTDRAGIPRQSLYPPQCINNGVTGDQHAEFCDTFAQEIGACSFRWSKMHIRDHTDDASINFFRKWMPFVVTPESRFDVADFDTCIERRYSCGGCSRSVAVN